MDDPGPSGAAKGGRQVRELLALSQSSPDSRSAPAGSLQPPSPSIVIGINDMSEYKEMLILIMRLMALPSVRIILLSTEASFYHHSLVCNIIVHLHLYAHLYKYFFEYYLGA